MSCATGQSCQSGVCVSNPCSTGLTLCGPSNCRNLTNDAAHCGACSRACAAGQTCQSSVCVGATMRFSLSWNATADLDIAVVTPSGLVISYSILSAGGGVHGGDSMITGPEQVTWASTPPPGTYIVCVIPYRVTTATGYTLQAFRGATLATTRTGTHSTVAPSGSVCSATSPYRVLDFVY